MTTSLWQSATMRSFVEQVQQTAHLQSAEEAEALARATLTVLAESITGGQVDELMQGLPAELQHDLSARSDQARALDKIAFLDRISGQIRATDFETTEAQTRAVLVTLKRWAPEGEIDDTIAQLPQSIAAMFQ